MFHFFSAPPGYVLRQCMNDAIRVVTSFVDDVMAWNIFDVGRTTALHICWEIVTEMYHVNASNQVRKSSDK